MQTLTGHTSPETAYVVADYPYGFRLRCSIRYWIEHKAGHGFRLVSQTTNPKKDGQVWNKPKAGIYYDCAVMVLDGDERVAIDTVHAYSAAERIDAFEAAHAAALTPEHRAAIRFLRASLAAQRYVTVTVGPASELPIQTDDERRAIMRDTLALGSRDTAPQGGEAGESSPVVVTAAGPQRLLPGCSVPSASIAEEVTQAAMF